MTQEGNRRLFVLRGPTRQCHSTLHQQSMERAYVYGPCKIGAACFLLYEGTMGYRCTAQFMVQHCDTKPSAAKQGHAYNVLTCSILHQSPVQPAARPYLPSVLSRRSLQNIHAVNKKPAVEKLVGQSLQYMPSHSTMVSILAAKL